MVAEQQAGSMMADQPYRLVFCAILVTTGLLAGTSEAADESNAVSPSACPDLAAPSRSAAPSGIRTTRRADEQSLAKRVWARLVRAVAGTAERFSSGSAVSHHTPESDRSQTSDFKRGVEFRSFLDPPAVPLPRMAPVSNGRLDEIKPVFREGNHSILPLPVQFTAYRIQEATVTRNTRRKVRKRARTRSLRSRTRRRSFRRRKARVRWRKQRVAVCARARTRYRNCRRR